MVFALAACAKPANPTDPSTPSGPSNPSKPSGSGDSSGKTLQIWAVVGSEYDTVDKIDAKSWLWMLRAAIVEWAHLNNVKLQFVSNYDQSALMSAINSGSKPDLVFTNGQFPAAANFQLLEVLNEAQQDKIAEVIGDTWFLTHRNEVYGIQAPWCGANMVYYNETIMSEYGITKTPKDYIAAGEWTWDNYLKLCKECTRDIDGDGKMDTWGSTTYSVGAGYGATLTVDPATGKLTSAMDSPDSVEWLEKLHKAVVDEPCLLNDYKHATTPGSGIVMSSSDCEPYNFYHTYRELSNGDIIRAVPRPTKDGVQAEWSTTTWMFAIPKNSDEVDAAVDLLTYICKAGLKWMEDHSEGVFETEYEGIVGACEYSAAWLEQYNEFMEERHAKYEEIKEMWDVEFNSTLMESYKNSTKLFGGSYAGVVGPWQGAKGTTNGVSYNFEIIFKAPPATSLPVLSAAVKNMCDTYNTKFVF